MVKRQLALTLGSIVTGILILLISCKKINEATDLGGDLLPAVDNITTFDTIINVEAYNDLFTLGGTDSLKEDPTESDYVYEQFLGHIDADPLFGKTDAQMFFELKPTTYPFTFKNKPSPDSLFLDSVVLVLDHIETYGDSTISQTINVSEITSNFRVDTSYQIRKNTDITVGASLGSATILPSKLTDTVKAFMDTATNQMRIRLSDAFGNRLLMYDTAGANNAYSSDSAFKSKFKGFALRSTTGGNGIMGFDLRGTNTKLAIYYRYKHGAGSDLDTTVTYFNFKPSDTYGLAGSAIHNYIGRDYNNSQIAAVQGGTAPDGLVYIQNTPGSFARIKIPALAGLSNRVVHRAELIAEQEYDQSDTIFKVPTFMYLDAFNSSVSRARNIPYDIVYDAVSQSYNLNSFGVVPANTTDAAGNVIKSWHFNLTRYVQHIVNGTEPLYDLRLFSPLYTDDQYFAPIPNPTVSYGRVFINPNPVKGRVRLTGNTGTSDTRLHRMRLRIVYSKI